MLTRFNKIIETIMQRRLYALAALWLLITLVFFQVLSADYVAYDEQFDVLANPSVNSPLSWHSLAHIFTSFEKGANQYTPLSTASFWLEKNLFGLNSAVSHLLNLLLHLACATAAFYLALLLTGNNGSAWVVAALWAIHPLQVETVAWVLERRNLLYAVFLFCSLACYAQYCETSRKLYLNLASGCMLFSGLAKTLAFMMPLAWFLIDWFKGRKISLALVREKAVGLVLSVFFLLLLFAAAMGGISRTESGVLDWSLAAYSVSFYFAKTFLPYNLSPVFETNSSAEAAIAYGPVYLLFLAVLVPFAVRRNKLAIAGLLLFISHIFPLSGLIRVGLRFYAACHFMYVPLFGLLLAVVALLTAFSIRLAVEKWLPLLSCLLLIITGVASFSQAGIWQNTMTLFEYALRLNPDSVFARRNLAYYYFENGYLSPAALHYAELVKRSPDNRGDRRNFASILFEHGKLKEAGEQFAELTRRFPDYHEGYSGLANVLFHLDEREKSLKMYDRAIELHHEPSLFLNRGVARFAENDLIGAESDFDEFLEHNSVDPTALMLRSEVRRKRGNYVSACQDIELLAEKNPASLSVRTRLFELLCESGNYGKASHVLIDVLMKLSMMPEKLQTNLSIIFKHGVPDFVLRISLFRGLIRHWFNWYPFGKE